VQPAGDIVGREKVRGAETTKLRIFAQFSIRYY
jgi:hypothetical protein